MKKDNYPIRIAQIMGKWIGGGVEAVVMNYYRHIDRTKIQFDFICDEDSTNIPYEEIESLGGKVILIPPYQKMINYHKKLKQIFKENKYQIVHSHINTLSVFSLWAAWSAKVPVRIAHSHSTTNKKEWKKNILKNILKPFSKVFANKFMCCTEHAGRWLFGNKEFDKGNVYVLNNAIYLDDFKYDKEIRKKIRKDLSINDDTFVVGHIGRFVAQKNHEFVIDVFSKLHKKNKNSILILIGQGPLKRDISDKVNNLELNDFVLFLGQRNDANKFYQAFDLFLFPSLYEGLGMVAIESQVSGCPVVCSTEVPSIVKLTEIVKFVDLDSSINEWISSCFDKLIERKDYSNVIAAHGYDITLESKKIVEIYETYLKEVN